jgi:hypothetical protein
MTCEELFRIMEFSGIIRNHHYYDRYRNMINYYIAHPLTKQRDKKGEIEAHHILPVGVWKEYKNEKCNIVNLPSRAHLIVHYMLYKCLDHPSCIFAFNQMSRVSRLNSRLYANHRTDLANAISLMNSGRKHTEEQRRKKSEENKGKNNYRNMETNEIRKFKVREQPEGWVPFQTGRVRTEKSKRKLGDKIKGRKWQYNSETKEICFDYELKSGFILGYPDWLVEDREHNVEQYKWAYCPRTGKSVRTLEEDIPVGFIKGRKYNNEGFNKINHSGLIRVLDVEKLEFILVDQETLNRSPEKYIKHGSGLDDILVFEYKGKTVYSWSELSRLFPELPKYAGSRKQPDKIMNHVIPNPHFNQTPERKEFCTKYKGMTLKDVGMIVKKLKE